MLKIRFSRTGRRNYPSYRVAVTESAHKREGSFVEIIGHYNLQQESPILKINKERWDYWKERGAQPSEGVIKAINKILPELN